MTKVLLPLVLVFTLFSATVQADESLYPSSPEQTCLDEYRKHRNGLVGMNVGAPFAGVGGTIGLMFAGARIEQALVPGAFLSGLAGAVYGMFLGAGIYVTVQGVLIYKLVKDATMINLIKAAYESDLKKFSKLVKRLNRKYGPFDQTVTSQNLLEKIKELDQKGMLCNAAIVSKRRQKKYAKRGKLKHALAYKKDVLKFLATQY